MIPPGYTWNTALFLSESIAECLHSADKKLGAKPQHLQEHDTMMRNKCFAKFVFFWRLCKFVRIIFAARLTRRCNWKTIFCNSGVFSATGCFFKKTSRQICTYSSIYVRSTAEIAVGQKIYLYAGLCRNVLSIRIICGSFGNVDSFERTRRESEEEQGITETLT